MSKQLVVYYVQGKEIKSANLSEDASAFVRHVDPLRGEMLGEGEVVCVQFWQGKQAGNFFVMYKASDVWEMLYMAKSAGSSYEWMAGDPVQLGVPALK